MLPNTLKVTTAWMKTFTAVPVNFVYVCMGGLER